jgi:hypothetical protein
MNPPYRTRGGRILTQEELDALAAEAERGYDVEKLARREAAPDPPPAQSTKHPDR